MGRHTRHAHLTDEEFCEVAAANVEAMNLALRLANVPPEQVRSLLRSVFCKYRLSIS